MTTLVSPLFDWRGEVEVKRWGSVFGLSPSEYVERAALFFPNYYDPEEFAQIAKFIRPGDTFVDIGANIGCYTAFAAQCVGPSGRIIAIEANPSVFERLRHLVERNDLRWVELVHKGMSDREEILDFWPQSAGNLGASTFLPSVEEPHLYGATIKIPCVPLAQVAGEHVRFMKLDIEGFELRVLERYFEDVLVRPDYILTECWQSRSGERQVIHLLQESGYALIWARGDNYLYEYSKD